MNKDFIQQELQGLVRERENAFAHFNKLQGAIQAYEIMLKQHESDSIPNGHDNGVSIEEVVNAVEAIPEAQ